ncbi:hypothetical protein G5C51_35710 [Streptomyces sp. A7024]|uniref:Uncharacterized protein n=1 Tax=Streptomyces coryli TaxID=1128680 RepID=A0A6G4UBX9_9ACTN|nr:hypothetical protein [Streptomyces coryli]NGN69220.1 hypothetical protein [Streptomyces coryli]
MDQGLAAAFAGAVGVVGSIGGGFLGGWLGGKKTVEAARLQVMAQAELSQKQWLQEKRQENYVAMQRAHADVKELLMKLGGDVRKRRGFTDAEYEELTGRVLTFNSALWGLRLLGPKHVAVAGLELAQKTQAAVRSLKMLRDGEVSWESWDRLRVKVVDGESHFTELAGDVIRDQGANLR